MTTKHTYTAEIDGGEGGVTEIQAPTLAEAAGLAADWVRAGEWREDGTVSVRVSGPDGVRVAGVEVSRSPLFDGEDEMTSERIITVWLDETSDEHGWVVDTDSPEGGESETLDVFPPTDEGYAEACEYAREEAERRGCEVRRV